VQTINENKSFYSDRQIAPALRARELMHTLGCPSVADLKRIIKMNAIKDCPVTVDDIILAKKIFGLDVASLKGKKVRQTPTPVVAEIIEIPRELMAAQEEVELCIDTFFINPLPFFSTISRNIKYRTCDFVQAQTVAKYCAVLSRIILLYAKTGFKIKCIYGDNKYGPVLEYFKNGSANIDYVLANANEHVPEAECNNRTKKECIRETFHSLPFQAIPTTFIKHLATETAEKLNFFPPVNGILAYYSPREIMSQQRLDYVKHCSVTSKTRHKPSHSLSHNKSKRAK